MNQYPIVAMIARYGQSMALALGFAIPTLAILLVGAYEWPPVTIIGGVVLGPVVYVLAASYVERIRIVWDTLVPK